MVADVRLERTAWAEAAFGAEIADPDRVHAADADVYSPNALGGAISAETISELGAPLVCGGANNQLATPDMGAALLARRITFAPDFLVNAGGVINVACEFLGEPRADVSRRIRQIPTRLISVLEEARGANRAPHEIAEQRAWARIHGRRLDGLVRSLPRDAPLDGPVGGCQKVSMGLKLIPAIHRVTHQIGFLLEQAADLKVTQAEAHILAHLAEHGPSSVAELHQALAHKRSTLTSILDRLAARGLVTRDVSPRDRRSFVIALTGKGARLAARVLAALEAVEAAAAEAVGGDKAIAIAQALLARLEAAARPTGGATGDD